MKREKLIPKDEYILGTFQKGECLIATFIEAKKMAAAMGLYRPHIDTELKDKWYPKYRHYEYEIRMKFPMRELSCIQSERECDNVSYLQKYLEGFAAGFCRNKYGN